MEIGGDRGACHRGGGGADEAKHGAHRLHVHRDEGAHGDHAEVHQQVAANAIRPILRQAAVTGQ